MYCQTCGSALTLHTNFCNRCGTQLAPAVDKSVEKTASEKRLDEYLDGLFWISVFGLAFIFGGMIVLTQVNFSNLVVIGYVILSSIVFLINFGLSFWKVLAMMKSAKQDRLEMQRGPQTRELPPQRVEPISVTENTTRLLEKTE